MLSLWFGIGFFVYNEVFFRINIGKFVALNKCLRKWKPILVSCGHVLEPRFFFFFFFCLDLKYSVMENHRFGSKIRSRFQGSGRSPHQKLWAVPPGKGTGGAVYKQQSSMKVVCWFNALKFLLTAYLPFSLFRSSLATRTRIRL